LQDAVRRNQKGNPALAGSWRQRDTDRDQVPILHLAAASANVLLLELKPEPSPMQHELVTDPIEMKDGWIAVRDAPGLGVTVDEAAVRRYGFA
jgi:L-alanine-DL-glutamate epimerase-like enolase superfamily enzyme